MRFRLRTLLLVSTGVLWTLGIVTAAILVFMTSSMRHGATVSNQAIESVRAAQELEIGLLGHDRERRLLEATGNPMHAELMNSAERDVKHWQGQIQRYVTQHDERTLVDETLHSTRAYLDADAETARSNADGRNELLDRALMHVEQLVDLNVGQANQQLRSATWVDQAADVVALTVAVTLILAISGTLLLIRRWLYDPLLALRAAIARFKSGDRRLRAPPTRAIELSEIADEFNSMADTLHRHEQMQLEFLAAVAHELRNPLHALKLSASSLTRKTELPPEERIRKTIDRIGIQADRLNRMVSDLLDRTRIEAGRLELQFESCDLREISEHVVELHRELSNRHLLVLEVSQPVPLFADPMRVEQVVTNLVSNAIKYSPSGGEVRIRVGVDEGEAVLSVSDQGVGLAPDELKNIFDPFRRARSTQSDIPGSGLGLSVSRRIVEGHGGHITVASTPRLGSTFEVRLPLASAQHPLPQPARPH